MTYYAKADILKNIRRSIDKSGSTELKKGRGYTPPPAPVKRETRLAGDGIAALKEALPEQTLGPAYERLLGKAEEINAFDNLLMDAGVPASEFRGMQRLQVPELVGNVPAPYVDNSVPGMEQRIHLMREGDELVPISNSNPEAGEFLVTRFGKDVDMEGETKASEYVQNHILQLMGYEPRRGPKGKVDFIVNRGGKEVGIDGQAQEAGRQPVVEVLTKAIPTNREGGGYGYGYPLNSMNPEGTNTQSNRDSILRDMQDTLGTSMRATGSLKGAIGHMLDNRLIQDDRNLLGKLYKADYDEVLMPLQGRDQHLDNAKEDRIAIAPEGVVSYAMNEIRPAIEALNSPRSVRTAFNAGDHRSYDKQARVKVRADVPRSALHDVVAENPHVGQILRNLPYA